MRTRAPIDNALPPSTRARLAALAAAALGCEWDSPEVAALAAYCRSLRPVLPWHVPGYVGAHEFSSREMGGAGDVVKFVAGMGRLSRCVDFGEPYSCRRCAPCRRQAALGEHFTWEEQQAFEAAHGSIACERGPRFEGD